MGIEHVYDSRSTEFADADPPGHRRLRRRHRAQLAARCRAAGGLELLSFGGRFVEIGKRDIYGDTRLGLFPFRRNLSFYAVDLGLMRVTHPETRSVRC